MMHLVLWYLLAINSLTFLLYGVDKFKAKHHRWRIPEYQLLLLALIGGSLGAWMGMKVWQSSRRKTK